MCTLLFEGRLRVPHKAPRRNGKQEPCENAPVLLINLQCNGQLEEKWHQVKRTRILRTEHTNGLHKSTRNVKTNHKIIIEKDIAGLCYDIIGPFFEGLKAQQDQEHHFDEVEHIQSHVVCGRPTTCIGYHSRCGSYDGEAPIHLLRHRLENVILLCDIETRVNTSAHKTFGCLGELATTHAVLGLVLGSRVHVVANLIEVFFDLLVHAMLKAPLDKRKLSDRRAMNHLGAIDFGRLVEDVRATTKRVKEQAVIALELILLVEIGIDNGRANLQELRATLGKVGHGPVKGTQSRALGAFIIQRHQRAAKAILGLKVGLDNFLQQLALTIRDAMLNLFVVVTNFDRALFEPKGAFHIDSLGPLGDLLKFLIFAKIILGFKFALANAPRTSTRRLCRAQLNRHVTWNHGIKLHFEEESVRMHRSDKRTPT